MMSMIEEKNISREVKRQKTQKLNGEMAANKVTSLPCRNDSGNAQGEAPGEGAGPLLLPPSLFVEK